jgi:hypothetical protein
LFAAVLLLSLARSRSLCRSVGGCRGVSPSCPLLCLPLPFSSLCVGGSGRPRRREGLAREDRTGQDRTGQDRGQQTGGQGNHRRHNCAAMFAVCVPCRCHCCVFPSRCPCWRGAPVLRPRCSPLPFALGDTGEGGGGGGREDAGVLKMSTCRRRCQVAAPRLPCALRHKRNAATDSSLPLGSNARPHGLQKVDCRSPVSHAFFLCLLSASHPSFLLRASRLCTLSPHLLR